MVTVFFTKEKRGRNVKQLRTQRGKNEEGERRISECGWDWRGQDRVITR